MLKNESQSKVTQNRLNLNSQDDSATKNGVHWSHLSGKQTPQKIHIWMTYVSLYYVGQQAAFARNQLIFKLRNGVSWSNAWNGQINSHRELTAWAILYHVNPQGSPRVHGIPLVPKGPHGSPRVPKDPQGSPRVPGIEIWRNICQHIMFYLDIGVSWSSPYQLILSNTPSTHPIPEPVNFYAVVSRRNSNG